MRMLYRKLGKSFKRAAAAFLAVMEAPAILTLTFICMPAASAAFEAPPPRQTSFIEAALALSGLLHLQAAVRNLMIEHAEKKRGEPAFS